MGVYSAAELAVADRARAGDREALVELYERYREPLYRHAFRMLRSEAQAQDIVQESFARAIAAIPRTGEQLKFKAWIYRIATNLCLRQLNKRSRWQPSTQEQTEQLQAHAPEADPERGRRRQEIAKLVLAALEELPPRYRQILLLREIEELSYEELAGALESDIGRVKVTLHRARARFAALFVAAQLSAERSPRVKCDDLRVMLDGRSEQRSLVKHLESCSRCRKRENRPAAELFAMLPVVPFPQWPAAPTPGGAGVSATGGSGAAGLASSKAAAPLLAVGVGAAVVVAVAVGGIGLGTRADDPPRIPARAKARPKRAPRPSGKVLSQREPKRASRRTPEARPTKLASRTLVSTSKSRPPAIPKQKDGRRTTPASAPAVGSGQILALGARRRLKRKKPGLRLRLYLPDKGAVVIRKGRAIASLSARDGSKLRLGDTLRSRSGQVVGVRLPGGQALRLSGSLRLDALPGQEQPLSRVRVTLLRGRLWARATITGRGITVYVASSRVVADSGELRVRRDKRGLRVEALEGTYLVLRGPHASRKVPPGSGVQLASRPGFVRGLLAAPSRLRPIRFRSPSPPRLTWRAVAGALRYRVKIASDTDFLDVKQVHKVAENELRPRKLPLGKYFWQVTASNGKHHGRTSKIYSFVITR